MTHRLKQFYFSVLIFAIFSCKNDRSKSQLDHTTTLSDGKLYVETYLVSKALSCERRLSDYLTDSTNFRKYVGSYDTKAVVTI